MFLQLARRTARSPAIGCLAGAEGARNGDRIHGRTHSRSAGQDRGADSSHRARPHRCVRHHQVANGSPRRRPELCCRARRAISSPPCAGPDVRGQWGEITLRRLVELSGMTSRVDFTEQPHRSTDTGAVRPDMVVHMPEQRDIVVDVKTPLEAYLAAVEAQNDEERSRATAPPRADCRRADSRAVLETVLVAVRTQSGLRRAVPARRSIPVGGAAGEPGTDRRSAAAERDGRDPDQSGGATEGRLVRLEANGFWPRMPRRSAVSAKTSTSAWRCSASIWAGWENRSAAASTPSTRRSARWNSRYCPPRAAFRDSDCASIARSNRSSPCRDLTRIPRDGDADADPDAASEADPEST